MSRLSSLSTCSVDAAKELTETPRRKSEAPGEHVPRAHIETLTSSTKAKKRERKDKDVQTYTAGKGASKNEMDCTNNFLAFKHHD